jgi:hypothetical protein
MALSTAAKTAWANSQASTTTLYKLLGIDFSFKQELGVGLKPSVGGYLSNFYTFINAFKDEAAVVALIPTNNSAYTGLSTGQTAYNDLVKKGPSMMFETKKSAYDTLLPIVSYLTALIGTPGTGTDANYTVELAQFAKYGGRNRPEVDIYDAKVGINSEDADLNFQQQIYETIVQIQSAIVKLCGASELNIALV